MLRRTAQIEDDEMTALAPIDELATSGHLLSRGVTTYELPENVVGVMAEPGDAAWEADLAPISRPLPERARTWRSSGRPDQRAVPPESVMVTAKPRRPKATRTAKARPRRSSTEPEAKMAAACGRVSTAEPETPVRGSTAGGAAPSRCRTGDDPRATARPSRALPAPEAAIAAPRRGRMPKAPEAIVVTPTWLAKATDAAKARPGHSHARGDRRWSGPGAAATEATGPAFEAPEPEAITAEPVLTAPEATTAEPAIRAGGHARPRLAQAARAAKARLRRRTPWPTTLDPEPDAPEPDAPEPKRRAGRRSGSGARTRRRRSRPVVEPTTPAPARAARRRPTARSSRASASPRRHKPQPLRTVRTARSCSTRRRRRIGAVHAVGSGSSSSESMVGRST